MRKYNLVVLIMLCLLLLSCGSSFATVGVYKEGTYQGEASDLEVAAGQGVAAFTEGDKANIPIGTDIFAVGVYNGSATSVVTDITALSSAYKTYEVYVATRTLTLANGEPGQIVTFYTKTTSDTGTTTITATTKTCWTSAAMDTVGDLITLMYVDDTIGWIVIGTNSITVTY